MVNSVNSSSVYISIPVSHETAAASPGKSFSRQLSSVSMSPQEISVSSGLKPFSKVNQSDHISNFELVVPGEDEMSPLREKDNTDVSQIESSNKKCLSNKQKSLLLLGTSAAALALYTAKNIFFPETAILPGRSSLDTRQPVDEMIYADLQPDSDLIKVNAEIVQRSIPETLSTPEDAMSSTKSRHYLAYSAHAPKKYLQ
ncbi:hypothetical protein [Kalamiella sp. sgz302252]|uniref:hypothetical protein n=1 Tax=Pantoea sp. sgz302252 TaxID=3341827 RepID=UPI0036D3D91C